MTVSRAHNMRKAINYFRQNQHVRYRKTFLGRFGGNTHSSGGVGPDRQIRRFTGEIVRSGDAGRCWEIGESELSSRLGLRVSVMFRSRISWSNTKWRLCRSNFTTLSGFQTCILLEITIRQCDNTHCENSCSKTLQTPWCTFFVTMLMKSLNATIF